MIKNAEFERCADFLARMIEKYGNEVDLPETAERTDEEKSLTMLDGEKTA